MAVHGEQGILVFTVSLSAAAAWQTSRLQPTGVTASVPLRGRPANCHIRARRLKREEGDLGSAEHDCSSPGQTEAGCVFVDEASANMEDEGTV